MAKTRDSAETLYPELLSASCLFFSAGMGRESMAGWGQGQAEDTGYFKDYLLLYLTNKTAVAG